MSLRDLFSVAFEEFLSCALRRRMIAVMERVEIEIFFCRTAHFLLDDRRLFVWMISEA